MERNKTVGDQNHFGSIGLSYGFGLRSSYRLDDNKLSFGPYHMKNKPKQDLIFEIMRDAVNLEKDFICEAIPCDMIGMNKKLMAEYIEFVADRLLQQLNFDKLYNTENPFDFMERLSIEAKVNFFEARNSNYQLGGHSGVLNEAFEINDDDDF